MVEVFVVWYPYDSLGIIAVFFEEEHAKFLVETLNNKRSESVGLVEYKKMEVRQ